MNDLGSPNFKVCVIYRSIDQSTAFLFMGKICVIESMEQLVTPLIIFKYFKVKASSPFLIRNIFKMSKKRHFVYLLN